MKITKLIGTSAAAALLVMIATDGPARAKGPPPADPVDCGQVLVTACFDKLDALCRQIDESWFANDRDRFNLIGKVVEASMKIEDGKFADADQKLDNIQTKVDDLDDAGKLKIDPQDADDITALRIQASICVNGLD